MSEIYQKEQQMYCGIINVILLHGDHRHVSATYVVIFRVVRANIQIHLQCIGSLHSQSNITVLIKIPVK